MGRLTSGVGCAGKLLKENGSVDVSAVAQRPEKQAITRPSCTSLTKTECTTVLAAPSPSAFGLASATDPLRRFLVTHN